MTPNFLNKKISTENSLITIMFCVIVFPFLLPRYFSDKVGEVPYLSELMTFLSLGLGAILILQTVRQRSQKNSVRFFGLFLLILSYVVLFATTFLRSGNLWSIVTHILPVLMFCLLVGLIMGNPAQITRFLRVVCYMSLVFCLLNLAVMIVHPEGIPEMSSSVVAGFIYGNVNASIRYMFPGMCASSILDHQNGKRLSFVTLIYIISILYCCFRIYFMGTAFLAVVFLLLWFVFEKVLSGKERLLYFTVLCAVFVIEIFVVVFSNNIGLSTLITDLFGKSADFSGRRRLWDNAFRWFRSNPMLGWGLLSREQQHDMIGNYYGSHNYFLDLLVQRGVLGFIPVLLFWILPLFHFRKVAVSDKTVFCLTGYCSALLIMFLSEPFYPAEVFFVPIFFAFLCKLISLQQNREFIINGGKNGRATLSNGRYNNA